MLNSNYIHVEVQTTIHENGSVETVVLSDDTGGVTTLSKQMTTARNTEEFFTHQTSKNVGAGILKVVLTTEWSKIGKDII